MPRAALGSRQRGRDRCRWGCAPGASPPGWAGRGPGTAGRRVHRQMAAAAPGPAPGSAAAGLPARAAPRTGSQTAACLRRGGAAGRRDALRVGGGRRQARSAGAQCGCWLQRLSRTAGRRCYRGQEHAQRAAGNCHDWPPFRQPGARWAHLRWPGQRPAPGWSPARRVGRSTSPGK